MFQSTRPVRDATRAGVFIAAKSSFQSTRPVRDATYIYSMMRNMEDVSIHASRAGRDVTGESSAFVLDGFQSTRPVRDATR